MSQQRLFLALWPDNTITNSIKQNSRYIKNSIKGKFVANANWHITLAFLGNVDNKSKHCLIEQAGQIKCSAFSVAFDKLMYFKKSQIVSYGLSSNSDITNLNLLVDECKRIQNACGLITEERQYTPHITLARQAKELENKLVIDPVLWQANEFVLVLSEQSALGSVYTILQSWPLMA